MEIPQQEKIVLTYVFDGVDCYIVTQNYYFQEYVLYKIKEKGYRKLKTSNTPLDFDEIVKKDRRK